EQASQLERQNRHLNEVLTRLRHQAEAREREETEDGGDPAAEREREKEREDNEALLLRSCLSEAGASAGDDIAQTLSDFALPCLEAAGLGQFETRLLHRYVSMRRGEGSVSGLRVWLARTLRSSLSVTDGKVGVAAGASLVPTVAVSAGCLLLMTAVHIRVAGYKAELLRTGSPPPTAATVSLQTGAQAIAAFVTESRRGVSSSSLLETVAPYRTLFGRSPLLSLPASTDDAVKLLKGCCAALGEACTACASVPQTQTLASEALLAVSLCVHLAGAGPVLTAQVQGLTGPAIPALCHTVASLPVQTETATPSPLVSTEASPTDDVDVAPAPTDDSACVPLSEEGRLHIRQAMGAEGEGATPPAPIPSLASYLAPALAGLSALLSKGAETEAALAESLAETERVRLEVTRKSKQLQDSEAKCQRALQLVDISREKEREREKDKEATGGEAKKERPKPKPLAAGGVSQLDLFQGMGPLRHGRSRVVKGIKGRVALLARAVPTQAPASKQGRPPQGASASHTIRQGLASLTFGPADTGCFNMLSQLAGLRPSLTTNAHMAIQ
ncbi:hypothetical protein KIPB_004816, partial [Kipferlia bialata]